MCTEGARDRNCADLDSAEEYLTGLLNYMQNGGKLTSIKATVNCALVRAEAGNLFRRATDG